MYVLYCTVSECKVIPTTVYMQYTVHRQDLIDKYLYTVLYNADYEFMNCCTVHGVQYVQCFNC